MIGIKVKNTLLRETLCALYPEKITPFQENTPYEYVLTDDLDESKENVLTIGPTKDFDLKTPFSLAELTTALLKLSQKQIELKFFNWNTSQRTLTEKNTPKIFVLTQKEAELIDFLWEQPCHQATKEQILSQVWHYHEKAYTHTLTTHLYGLKRKVGKNKLILFKKGKYTLI